VTDYAPLDAAVAAIRGGNPKIAHAFDEVEKILKTVAPPASDVPAPPSLTSPVTFTAQNGASNFFDAGGQDCIVKSSGPILQSATPSNNAVVTLKNFRRAIVEPLHIHSDHLQTGPGQNGYGYGFYAIGGDTLYMEPYAADGAGMAQCLVIAGGTRLVQLIEPALLAMHPVYTTNPFPVHTDAIQSYGGPGTLELYDAGIITCGSAIQVQPYNGVHAPSMGTWNYHRVAVRQVPQAGSDQMPFCLTKDPSGGAKWPTDTIGCTIHALGTPFGVSWVSDPAAWAPGGTWSNTGEAWVPA
jgi:hypothetical protein